MSDTDHTDELLSELRRDGVRIESDVLRRMLDEMGIMFTADDSHEILRTYFYDWEYDEDLYGKGGVYSDRTELSTVCLTAEEAVETALGVWNENERLRSCLSDADENARQIMGEYGELEAENERLRKKLEFERENNGSIRRLFDAVAPRCGKPDCPSLVEYVEQLRELVRDAIQAMWACDSDICVHRCECDQGIEYPMQMDCLIERRARELGIEVE